MLYCQFGLGVEATKVLAGQPVGCGTNNPHDGFGTAVCVDLATIYNVV